MKNRLSVLQEKRKVLKKDLKKAFNTSNYYLRAEAKVAKALDKVELEIEKITLKEG